MAFALNDTPQNIPQSHGPLSIFYTQQWDPSTEIIILGLYAPGGHLSYCWLALTLLCWLLFQASDAQSAALILICWVPLLELREEGATVAFVLPFDTVFGSFFPLLQRCLCWGARNSTTGIYAGEQ